MTTYDELLRDAARWRALMNCGRMHGIGSAGFQFFREPDGDRPAPRPNFDYLLLGMEFWTRFEHKGHKPGVTDHRERRMLEVFADQAMAEQGAIPLKHDTRLTPEKLLSIMTEELKIQGVTKADADFLMIGSKAADAHGLTQSEELLLQVARAAVSALNRVAMYADHLRDIIRRLDAGPEETLSAILHKTKEKLGCDWDDERLQPLMKAIQDARAELKAEPNDG